MLTGALPDADGHASEAVRQNISQAAPAKFEDIDLKSGARPVLQESVSLPLLLVNDSAVNNPVTWVCKESAAQDDNMPQAEPQLGVFAQFIEFLYSIGCRVIRFLLCRSDLPEDKEGETLYRPNEDAHAVHKLGPASGHLLNILLVQL